jgi:hypothetical protein
MKAEKTISDYQSEIEAALDRLPVLAAQLPPALKPLLRLAPRKGLRAQVSLRRGTTAKDSRQVKQSAPASGWLPDSGFVAISYLPSSAEDDRSAVSTVEDVQDSPAVPAQTPESRSGFNPIAMRGEPLSQTALRERR